MQVASASHICRQHRRRQMVHLLAAMILAASTSYATSYAATPASADSRATETDSLTLNQKEDGYRGIWYSIAMPPGNEQPYKYSGGLGTYCDYHASFAVYRQEVEKTFFCYGGVPDGDDHRLLHMVSYFDHKTLTVPRPTVVLDKQTDDAHDNPVMTIDSAGYIWIFSTSHGVDRPSYIHRSKRPYDIDEFEIVDAVHQTAGGEKPIDNFSYLQVSHDREAGFRAFFTRYRFPVDRTACFMTSRDGVHWSEWQRLAMIGQGHYQVAATNPNKIATMLNMHPRGKGLDWRTNLYYLESVDNGETWQSADGRPLEIPLKDVKNSALVRDYQAEGRLVYVKDMVFDASGRPILIYSTSSGHEPGPANNPRELWLAHWDGSNWKYKFVTTMDHNYDSASLYLEASGAWRIVAPTAAGPQPSATGGEMVIWRSNDQGVSWALERQITDRSIRNHAYARRPVNAHPDFYAIWADGDAYKSSQSNLYFCNTQGKVFCLPRQMEGATAKPLELVRP